MTVLSAEHIQKYYWDSNQEIQVLQDINISIESGEFACISGQSGCGKSTLLHILGLLDNPDKGAVKIYGDMINAKSPNADRIRSKNIGFVFQSHYLLEELSVIENVALPMMILGHKENESLHEAESLLVRLGMHSRLKHYPKTLSGGEQQRVAIARALINKPAIVLADEPTGNLDKQHGTEVLDLLLQLNRELGTSLLLVTHDSLIAEKAQTNYRLSDGVLQSW